MVDPTLAAAAINAGGQAFNIYSQSRMNRKNREWNEKMYHLQRGHALEDWNRVNEYNSPQQQLARLKAAGINPQFSFGHGVSQSASPIKSTEMHNAPYIAPRIDTAGLANSITQFQKVDIQDRLADQQLLLLSAQTLKTLGEVDKNSLAYQLQLETYSYDALRIQAEAELAQGMAYGQTSKNEFIQKQIAALEQDMQIKDSEKALRYNILMNQSDMGKIAQRVAIDQNKRSWIESNNDVQEHMQKMAGMIIDNAIKEATHENTDYSYINKLNKLKERLSKAQIGTEQERRMLTEAQTKYRNKEIDWFEYEKILKGITVYSNFFSNMAGGISKVIK